MKHSYSSILNELPLFCGLSAKELQLIISRAKLHEFKKGVAVYREGSEASYFYYILRGRVEISSQDSGGRPKVLEYLHRGDYFGIISMLTGEPHSVTARAINDCLFLTIGTKDFEALLKKVPQFSLDLSKTLSRRLRRKEGGQKKIFESAIIAVMSSYPQAGKTLYASNLAFSLSRETGKSVIIVDICPQEKSHRMPRLLTHASYRVCDISQRPRVWEIREKVVRDRLGIDLVYLTYRKGCQKWPDLVVDLLSSLVNDYHFIILDLPTCREKTVLNILNQSDIIHILTSGRVVDLKSTARLIRKLEGSFHFPQSKIKVVTNERSPSSLPPEKRAELLGRDIFASLPRTEGAISGRMVAEKPQSDYAKVIRRISRQEGDCLVGLALGVGVAYGFCHIGVLRVLEEEKVPIDVISGSSMGAVIAGLWAVGYSSSEILHIMREFREPKHIWNLLDFTFPLIGFIKGDKLQRFLTRHLGARTFADVKVPLKIVASEVKRKESRVLDKGSIVDAIMASCSMPGVFRPFKFKEEMLYDGGVMNPLPTEPLLEMGAKKIIAVNLTPSREDILRHYEELKDTLSGKAKKASWFKIKDVLKEKLKHNLLDAIFSSFEIMQSEVAQKEAMLADVVLHPDLSGMHWLELHRSEEFARRGEEECRRNLDKIWKLINE